MNCSYVPVNANGTPFDFTQSGRAVLFAEKETLVKIFPCRMSVLCQEIERHIGRNASLTGVEEIACVGHSPEL